MAKKLLASFALATLVAGGVFAQKTQAEELAANINKIKRGSAAVSGATVTLAGEVNLTKALVVPEGVTLDVTANKTVLRLGNKTTLTVNGAMNVRGHGDQGKGWVNGSLQSNGTAVINGTGTINLKGKGRILNMDVGGPKVKLTLDGVTLAGVKDNNQPLVGIGKGGEFVLKSGAITGNTHLSDKWASGGGVQVSRGTFTMEGGTISGNTANGKDGGGGGGVDVGDNGTFVMSGGVISGNTATGSKYGVGGGVHFSGGTFTMSGGRIQGRTDSDGFTKNTTGGNTTSGALFVHILRSNNTAKWGTDGKYTSAGKSRNGGTDIVEVDDGGYGYTDDTLIATK